MTTITIDGVIGWDVSAADVRQAIREARGDDLTIEVNSPGGLVTEGIAIYNAIRNAPGNKTTRITGLAASMGSYIALAAGRVVAEPNAIYMIHNAAMWAGGDHNALRKAADIAEGMSKILAAAYVSKTGKDSEEVRAMMDEETYLYGQEIADAGFADEIAGGEAGDKAAAVLQTRAAVASAEDLIKRLTNEQDTDQAAACLAEMLPRSQVQGITHINQNNAAVGSVQAPGPKQKQEVNKMTEEQIAALKAEAYQAGIKAERKRVADLNAWKGINADADRVVDETVANGKSYEEVAAQLGAAVARGNSSQASGINAPEVNSGTVENASGASGLDEIDHAAASLFGLSPEDMKKYGKK